MDPESQCGVYRLSRESILPILVTLIFSEMDETGVKFMLGAIE